MASPQALGSDNLAERDGELYYQAGFLDAAEADHALQVLQGEMAWDQEVVTIVGRRIQVPRLVAWHGDPEAIYRYSGLNHLPKPWTPTLHALRERVKTVSDLRFNSVLGNWYRTGEDSMGWHADQEKSLGANPWIASVSLGAERLFKLRHNSGKPSLELFLGHGSLLLMGGCLQHRWRHCLPKSRSVTGARINLTFRLIHPTE
ncbi:MAG: alpha-ketoglutarate-dependent dioxygenase AlkB [Methylococcaceae bacterium]|nr:alpha-ketoglutarate-dependent dioxygenase AlkB [Methylococcaceae bacterium]